MSELNNASFEAMTSNINKVIEATLMKHINGATTVRICE